MYQTMTFVQDFSYQVFQGVPSPQLQLCFINKIVNWKNSTLETGTLEHDFDDLAGYPCL